LKDNRRVEVWLKRPAPSTGGWTKN
jgi:hypothetical protein